MHVTHVGEDLVVVLSGGKKHIGTVVSSTPRSSLTGFGVSATSSVINRQGHMDEIPGRQVAEHMAKALNTYVVCACGIHVDHADQQMIEKIMALCDELTRDAVTFLQKHSNERN